MRSLLKKCLVFGVLAAFLAGGSPVHAQTPFPNLIQGGTPPVGWGVGHAQLTVLTYKAMDQWSISLRVRVSNASMDPNGWLALGSELPNCYSNEPYIPEITAPSGYTIFDCAHLFSGGLFNPDAVVYAQYKFHYETVDDNMLMKVGDIYPPVFSYLQPAESTDPPGG